MGEGGGEEGGEEDVKAVTGHIVGKKLRFHFTDVDLPPQFLFDIELNAGIYNIKLNKKHPAFLNFFKLLSAGKLNDKTGNESEHGTSSSTPLPKRNTAL